MFIYIYKPVECRCKFTRISRIYLKVSTFFQHFFFLSTSVCAVLRIKSFFRETLRKIFSVLFSVPTISLYRQTDSCFTAANGENLLQFVRFSNFVSCSIVLFHFYSIHVIFLTRINYIFYIKYILIYKAIFPKLC